MHVIDKDENYQKHLICIQKANGDLEKLKECKRIFDESTKKVKIPFYGYDPQIKVKIQCHPYNTILTTGGLENLIDNESNNDAIKFLEADKIEFVYSEYLGNKFNKKLQYELNMLTEIIKSNKYDKKEYDNIWNALTNKKSSRKNDKFNTNKKSNIKKDKSNKNKKSKENEPPKNLYNVLNHILQNKHKDSFSNLFKIFYDIKKIIKKVKKKDKEYGDEQIIEKIKKALKKHS
jgi:hypothetical protein